MCTVVIRFLHIYMYMYSKVGVPSCVSLVAKLPSSLFLFHSKLFVGGLSYETTKGNLTFLL